MATFTAQIEDWVAGCEDFLGAVMKTSVQDVIREMKTPISAGGNMPVDTSFLQNSLVGVGGATIPQVDIHASGKGGPNLTNAEAIETMITAWDLKTPISFGFIAAYAMRQNYGFTGTDSLGRNYNQPGKHFLELAVQQWPSIIEKNQRRLAGELVFS